MTKDRILLSRIPNSPGTYGLIIRLDSDQTIDIGRLGRFEFRSGTYTYLGSAHGPGGLRARLNRHIREDKKIHWHIDYLRQVAELVGIFWTVQPDVSECDWVVEINALPRAEIPVRGFGASDCQSGCPAHLVYFPVRGQFQEWTYTLMSPLSGEPMSKLFIMR